MRPIEMTSAALPVAPEANRRVALPRGTPKAAFISQLIAERYRLAPQRTRRQAPLDTVVRSYDEGTQIAVRRLPAGYRLTIDA